MVVFIYYALVWSPISLFLASAVLLTIIVCIILKINNILNIMLFYGLILFFYIFYLYFSRRRVFRRFSYHNPLHNIENESYFEYYALLWSHGLSPFCSPARFLTIIVCVILKMNHILNIMLFYGLMGC